MGTDPFDEFEFKPLTEGLGFHQQAKAVAPAPSRGPASKMDFSHSAELDFTETEETGNPFTPALPRKETPRAQAAATATTSAVDDILNTLHQNRKLEIELDRKQRQDLRQTPRVTVWKTAAPKFSPMLLDSMLVMAASLLCLIIMLMITRVDLLSNLSRPDEHGLVYIATAALFMGVAFIYMVVHRVFLGFTPGEWAYDLRVGQPAEQNTGLYALRIIARQALVTVTGLFLLPVVGAALGRDIAGQATGLQLQRKT